MGSRERFEELDGLRGIAALWVVLFHLTGGLAHFWLRGQSALADAVVPFTANIEGTLAVDLFFIISGFVICMTLDRSRTVLDFAASRFARLFPAYWMAVAISVAVGMALPLPQLPVTAVQGAVNLTMLQDYLGVRAVDPSYWSLSIELGFYALMAVVLLTGQRRRIEALGLAWVLVAFASNDLLPQLGVTLPWRVLTGLAFRYAGLFYAGILFYRIRTERFTWWRVAGIAIGFATRVAFLPPKMIAIECGILLTVSLAMAGRLPILRTRPLLFLGTISYSLYLVHQPLGVRLMLGLHALGGAAWLNLAATLVMLIGLATVMTYAVERPGTRLLRRLYANWRMPAPAPAPAI